MPNQFKYLKILHTVLLLGMIFFAIISVVIASSKYAVAVDKTFESVAQAVAAGLSLISLLAGFSIFKKRLTGVHHSTEAAEKKMEMYRGACILWWALIEGPGLLALVFFILTGNYAFLALAGFQIALLALFMPRKSSVVILLNLTSEEVQRLEGNVKVP